jgi:PAS domain S-box-containing protein
MTPDQQAILDAVSEGIVGADADGRATFCNDALLKMTGYLREEIVGKSLHDLLHHTRRDGSKYPESECPIRRTVAVGKLVHLPDEVLWCKDGSCFSVEYWVRRVEQSQGETKYVATLRDVTDVQQAKEGLRQSEEKFRRILASAPDVAWTCDRRGRILYISPKAESILGYSKPEICSGATHLRLTQIHAEDFGRVNRAYNDLFENRVAYDVEYRIRHKDGRWIWVHDRAMVPHEEKGELYADGFLTDITPRKQAEEELQSQTAFLEAQANSTIDGILVVDRFGRQLMVNEHFGELFQLPPNLIADRDDRKMLAYVVQLIKNPNAFLAKVEYLYRHPAETSRDEIELNNGMILDRYSSPVVGKNGTYYGRVWTFRDMTERKRNEEALQQLSLAVEQSPVSVVITDPQARITYVNPKFTECTGYSAQEVLGANPRILNAGQCSREMYRDLWTTITQGRIWQGEFCNKKKNGEVYRETATITPIKNPKGAITHYLAIKEDITERRVLESQLRQAQKMEAIGQLAAGIAHEINTPTQFVSDNLAFLRDSWGATLALLEQYRSALRSVAGKVSVEVATELEKAEAQCDLDFIASEVPHAIEQSLDGVGRVAKIVRAMKEFSHPDSTEKTATALNAAIDSTITVARNEWKYVAEMVKDFDENLPHVMCYPGDINQVVLNLIVNAAHAIKEKGGNGEKGRITVGTRQREGCAEIYVSDTGTGIAESVRDSVFDPFFTTKEVGKRTGQGLALAFAVVVKKHKGKIWFETEIGHGTTFYISLPVGPAGSNKEE